ncbi:hypothetical protein FKW77_009443 [Venturia effusa]|uniref:SH3 domain-containing protein n=1 Tax=Venturia effusa TaxID=50376 RepID=A0A517L215_9PEZI|nr:hypothetical protein FKW77_009443 [Venturia effusa]
MNTQQSAWLWDDTRQKYYIFSTAEQCYVFQDGTRLAIGAQSSTQQSPGYSATPRNEASMQEATEMFNRQKELIQHQHRRDSINAVEHQFALLNIGPSEPTSYYTPVNQTVQTLYPSSEGAILQTAPGAEITDNELYNQGYVARGKITGTKEYKKQSRGFWKVGKVIKILWPELAGNKTGNQTVLSDERFRDEKIITKIRWAISTYGGRGCAKNVQKWQHCIVYTGKTEPGLLPGEQPQHNERAMLTAIPVRAKNGDKRLQMAAASRLNFGKMYTVEFNVKVFDFGDVRKSYVHQLVAQWKWVMDCDQKGNSATHTGTPAWGNATAEAVEDSDEDNEDNETSQLETVPENSGAINEAGLIVVGYGTAQWSWSEKGQLAMSAGDKINVTSILDDNWGHGQNVRTREEGSFPRKYVLIDGTGSKERQT